ncbi:MAG TPA: chromosome segregation protein SMC [Clostridiaceae bacterium]|nr:chromosome segregation protein SMC [Clostridiaceae bacterium]
MRLTAVDIIGFKSFSDATRIEFHEGVTAIVGPNGSGKSNITDAIRWVLGEQSTNELRAGRMADIVFAGTQSKRALGFAEVTIHFDNADGHLPLEYSEVAVTRRYFRSGESEYEINKAPCRLKDIVALFMDTGIGKDGYSIIGQGKVDQILSPKGDDRRQIFDEASGIVKFKTRKMESLRKLEQTDANLLRLDDILGELALRLAPLRKQAEDARAYRQYAEALKSLDIWYVDHQVKSHEQTLAELAADASDAGVAFRDAEARVLRIKHEYEQAGEALRDLDDAIEKMRSEHDVLSADKTTLLASRSRTELSVEHAAIRIRSLQDEAARLHEALDSKDGDHDRQAKKRAGLDALRTRYAAELKTQQSLLEEAVAAANLAAKKRQELSSQLDLVRQQHFDAKSRLVELDAELQILTRHLDDVKSAGSDRQGDQSRLMFQIESWQDEHARQSALAAEQDAELAGKRGEADKARDALTQKTEALAALDAATNQAAYRMRLLTDLDRQGEGYPGVVRRIEARRHQDSAMGLDVLGPLASLLEVSDGFELAVETALGPAANHIVTKDQKTAAVWIDWLKKTRGGRATFLPIAQMKAWPLDRTLLEKVKGSAGYLGTADTCVQVNPELDEIVGRLLGRTFVVDTLDHALDVFNRVNRMVRVVTLDGELLSPGGSVSGGFDQRTGAGVISRKNELKQLAKKQAEAVVAKAELETELDEARTALRALMQTCETLEQNRRETARAIESLNRTMEQGETALAAYQKADRDARSREMELAAALTELTDAKTKATAFADELTDREAELVKQLADEPSADNRSELEILRQDVQDLRVNLTSVEETIRSLDELAQHVQETRAAERQRLSGIEAEIKTVAAERDRAEEMLAKIHAEQTALERSLQTLADAVKAKQGERQALEGKRRDAFLAMEKEGETRGTLLAALEKLEAKKERIQNQIDELKNRLWEQYELVADELSVKLVPDMPDMTPTRAAREINGLRAKIRELGPVNPGAIDELADVSARVDGFAIQREDMEQARQELKTVIHDLDLAMKLQFKDGFTRIAAAFTQVFRELFNGGDATLDLADGDDLLESDIVIRAQPPGKKMQNLNPLSGGERSLTAIALLFAIMRLRPAPFCVFDEIESSLDDANVLRFADYIRKYSKRTQFVLVTHRKGTMESADRLYGVTMQERGVSSILSMQLETPGTAR